MIKSYSKKIFALIGIVSIISSSANAIHPTAPSSSPLTQNFSNSTVTPIVDNATTVSTITVSGANPYLWDLDLNTFIDHTFSADLDITLTSPAGTTVTITTDNGAGNDNVFAGTLWDNSANPGGPQPYSTNNGMVTDNVYADLTLASPLTAEESLGAFKGEDPNGDWTLTISDDLAGETGTLNSWSLDINSLPTTPISVQQTFTDSPALAIPAGPAVVSDTITVSGLTDIICDLDVFTEITHTFSADMDISLTSPAGTSVTLTTDNGAGNDNTFNGTVWDDSANLAGTVPYTTNNGLVTDHAYVNLTTASPLVPEEALAAFDGEDPNGDWTLTISDDLAGDSGTLANWELRFTTCAEPTPTPTSTPTSTATSTATNTPTSTPTSTFTATPTPTATNAGTVAPVNTPTPAASASPSQTVAPTSTPEDTLTYQLTQRSTGSGTHSAPEISLVRQTRSNVTLRSCFDFNKLLPKTANVFMILKAKGAKTETRKRLRRSNSCQNVNITRAGTYELYFMQTRFQQSNVLSKKAVFKVS